MSQKEILSRPFDQSLIKTRPGPGGKKLSYVEGAEYIKRLNEAFDTNWSFKVLEYKIFEKEVVVLGELTCHGVIKQSFGGSDIATNRAGDPVSLADSLKSAATDALKKGASLFGVGLHLYGESGDKYTTSSNQKGPQPMTEKQLTAILSIARSMGWNKEHCLGFCQERFHLPYNQLSKRQASELIEEMKGMAK